MLKKVVFILDDERAIDEIEDLADELASYGVTVCIIGMSLRNGINCRDCRDSIHFMHEKVLFNQGNSQGYTETKEDGILYITDNPDIHKRLADNKFPVIIYMHDGNRDKNFSYAEYAIENISEIEYESLKLGYLRLTGQPWTILETDRCIIRESTISDVDSFYEIYKEPSITKYMENLYADKDEEIEYIKDYIKKVYAFYGYGMWTIIDKASHAVIGRAGISWREGCDIPELGFVIAVPFQRQGYAYEVCKAIIRYGQEELGFSVMQALIMEGNEISKSLCMKLGFVYDENVEIDGVWYNRMVFSK